MKRIRALWLPGWLLGAASLAWAGGELNLTPGHGLSLVNVTPADRGRTPVRFEIRLSRGFQAQGIKDGELLVLVTNLYAIPPGAEILKATLKKTGHPGLFPPPSKDPAPFASRVEVPMEGKTPAVVMEGEGETAADVTAQVQEWLLKGVYTNLSLTLRVPTGAVEKASAGIQYVEPASVRLDIKYGDEVAKHRLPAPVIEKVAPEPDRTISIWWKPALPQEQIRGQRYWYEFELFLKDDLWTREKSASDARKLKFDQWKAAKETGEEFDKIAEWSTETDVSLGEVRDDAMEKLGPKRDLAAEAMATTSGHSNHWTDLVKAVPPSDPGAFANKAGTWLPLDIRYPQVWTDKLAAEEGYVRLNLGPKMLNETAPYKFRMRVRCSNGQTSPWTETAEVQQRNPGYLVWMTRACYRGRIGVGDPSCRGDLPYGMNVYDQAWGVRLEAAKEEWEPFQVFFKNDRTNTINVELRLGPLQGEKGTIPTWAMYPYQEIWIGDMVGSEKDRRPRFPPAAMVDPLAPLFNLYDYRPVKPGKYTPSPAPCQPGLAVGWWVDIKVPGSAPAGVYRGTATLVVDGKTEIALPVELEVWDFFMPRRRTLATTFGDAGSGQRASSYNRWLKLLHEHRAGGYGGRVRGYVKLYEPDPNYEGDETLDACYWDHYIRTIRPYVDGSLFEDGVPVPKVGLTGWYVGMSCVPPEIGWCGYTGNGKRSDERKTDMQFKYLRELRLIAKRMGFLEKLWFYDLDEPGGEPNALCTIATTFMHNKKAIPEAKCMVTSVSKDNLRGWITAYNTNPTWLLVGLNQWFFPRQELGEEYWLYNSFTFLADGNSHMNQRFVPWYGYREGSADWLCWITSYGADWDCHPEQGGDGLYLYPMHGADFGIGDHNFAPNLQLKQYREGMEDVELCELAVQAVGYQEARKIMEKCSFIDGQQDESPWGRWKRVGSFRGGQNYNADPRVVYQVRRELAQVILQHKPDDGSSKKPVPELVAEAAQLKAQGKASPALATVKKALQKAPADLEAGSLEIACCHALGMPQEALESALRLVRRNAQSGQAWKALGDTCALLSRFEDAHDCWQRALKLDLPEALKREVQASIADSSLEGTQVARGEMSPYLGAPDSSALKHFGTDLDHVRKWPQEAEGGAMYRGIGEWGGAGTLDPTPAGLTLKIAHVELQGKKLPKGAKVRRAYIVFPSVSGAERYGGNLSAYAVLRPWVNEHMTMFEYDRDKPWGEPLCGKEGVDRGPLYSPTGSAVIDPAKGEVRMDITRIFRDWVEGRYPNFGLALIPQGGSIMNHQGKLVVHYTVQ